MTLEDAKQLFCYKITGHSDFGDGEKRPEGPIFVVAEDAGKAEEYGNELWSSVDLIEYIGQGAVQID